MRRVLWAVAVAVLVAGAVDLSRAPEQQLAARAVLYVGLDDLRFDLGRNAGPQVGDGGEAGFVLVAQR